MADERSGESLGTVSLRVLAFLILTMLLTALIVLQQRGSGAFLAEFSATHEPEADHYLAGLVIADLLTVHPAAPLSFAREFALHFPQAGAGAPPLLGIVEGVGLAILSPATPAALLPPAVLAALLVVSAGWAVARWQNPVLGVAVGAVLLALPLIREATIVLTLALPVALLAFWAALAFGRFLRSGQRRWALVFAGLTMMALLTGPAALALVPLPLLGVAARGRWAALRAAPFWWALVPVAAVAMIGLFVLPSGLSGESVVLATPGQMLEAARRHWAALLVEFGPVLAGLAGFGALFTVIRTARGLETSGGPLMLVVLSAAFFAMLCLLPQVAVPPFAILPLVAPVLVLAAIGGMGLFGLLTSGWTTVVSLVVAVLLLLFAMPALLEPVRKPANGMDNVAQAFLAREAANPLILAAADGKGESALVAAVAQRDRQRSAFVLRGAQVLTRPGADGKDIASAGDLMHRLEELDVGFVAFDTSPAAQRLTHNRLLREAIRDFPEHFVRIASYPRDDGTGESRLYAVAGQSGKVLDRAAIRERLLRAGLGAGQGAGPAKAADPAPGEGAATVPAVGTPAPDPASAPVPPAPAPAVARP